MRRELGPIDSLDPKLALQAWSVVALLGFVVLMFNGHAKMAVEGLLDDTNAGA